MKHWTVARLLVMVAIAMSLIVFTGVATIEFTTAKTIQILRDQTVLLVRGQETADRIVRRVRRQMDTPVQADNAAHSAAFRALGDSINDDISTYLGTDIPIEERVIAARIKDVHNEVESWMQRVPTGAMGQTARMDQMDRLAASLDSLNAMRSQRFRHLIASNAARMRQLQVTSSFIGAAILVGALLVLRLLYRRIVGRLRDMAAAAIRIGAGDFTTRVQESNNDELAVVSRGFNAMTRQLHAERTHSEQIHDALHQSEERYRSLFSRVPVGLYRSTPAGVLLDANPTFLSVFGHDEDPVNNPSMVSEIVDPSSRALWREALDETPGTLEVVWMARAADGSERWVHDAATAVRNKDGAIEYYDGAVQEITDEVQTSRALRASEAIQREMEKQLTQSEKMHAIGRLAGGIAHDFNNLLTAISGYADLIRNEMENEGRGVGDIDEIQKAVDRGGRLTSQLLAFGSYRVVNTGPTDLGAVTAHTEQMLRRLIGANIVLKTELYADVWVGCGMAQVEQILLNLVMNARDAVGENGTIGIDVDAIDLDAESSRALRLEPGRYGRMRVSDNGSGMAPETVRRMFEPFFTTKLVGRGTGLGLSTVYGIVQHARGGMAIDTQVGAGTNFAVYLPAADAPAAVNERPRVPVRSTGAELLLVVEDEESVRILARRALERNGFTVVTADNGVEAVALLEAMGPKPALVITDIVMPHMGGPELARHIAASWPSIRVLFMSGYTADAFTHGSLDSDVQFIEKPFTPRELAAKIRAILDETREV